MPTPWPTSPPTREERDAFAAARPAPFWLDGLELPPADGPLIGTAHADLVIVGAGFMGLWAALHAKADDPSRDVLVLEAARAGAGASGRNGGFIEASLTHGLGNGLSRFPEEMPALERMATENFDGLVADLSRLGIDADLELSGVLQLALAPHEEAWLEEERVALERFGHRVEALRGAAAVGAHLRSPIVRSALWVRSGAGVLHPGKLVAGLRRAALDAGVRLHEGSAVRAIASDRGGVELRTDAGRVRAARVVLATNVGASLVPAMRRRIVPVYDYILVSEPLSAEQRAAIGWAHRQGLSDSANQFHYFRLTADHRILFGGYDAVYRYGGPVGAHLEDSPEHFARLSQHLFTYFPQLRGLRFTHRWGGAIDTCSRFAVFFGTAHGGRVAYGAGYTGLGVGATRWGARVALDLVDGRETEATSLRFVRSQPLPFPPEPLRSAAIQFTRRQLAAADERDGRRGAWLRTLDRLGLGFDS
jgi:glycine/D-amino acid oxidase-like deaminating enzyme